MSALKQPYVRLSIGAYLSQDFEVELPTSAHRASSQQQLEVAGKMNLICAEALVSRSATRRRDGVMINGCGETIRV